MDYVLGTFSIKDIRVLFVITLLRNNTFRQIQWSFGGT